MSVGIRKSKKKKRQLVFNFVWLLWRCILTRRQCKRYWQFVGISRWKFYHSRSESKVAMNLRRSVTSCTSGCKIAAKALTWPASRTASRYPRGSDSLTWLLLQMPLFFHAQTFPMRAPFIRSKNLALDPDQKYSLLSQLQFTKMFQLFDLRTRLWFSKNGLLLSLNFLLLFHSILFSFQFFSF